MVLNIPEDTKTGKNTEKVLLFGPTLLYTKDNSLIIILKEKELINGLTTENMLETG